MTITEKLYMMEAMERSNKERAARVNPVTVNATWKKTCRYGNTYEVRLDHEGFEEARKRGCTHVFAVGWSVKDAIRELNELISWANMSIGAVKESILNER